MSLVLSNSSAAVSESELVDSDIRTINSIALVYHADLFIIAVMAVLALLRLPRLIALFGTSTEWYSGHFFRYKPHRRSKTRVVQTSQVALPPSKEAMSSEDSHTRSSHVHLQRVNHRGAPVAILYPPHIASCTRYLRPLLGPLRARITPDISVAQAMVLAIYFYVLIYVSFYKSNPFTDPMRTGYVSVSQMPLVFLFASKNNPAGALIGYGYEKLNFLHRFGGRLVVLAANIHSIYYFFVWTNAGTFKANIKVPSHSWGLAALLALDALFFFSIAFWRHKAYSVFLTTHVLGFLVLLPATYFHKPSVLPYVFACLIIFALDHVLRIFKTRISTATLRPMSEMEVTRVEVPYVNAGWRAGQHVRLRVLSFSLGWWAWTEVHPFTIASVSGSEEGMVLMCKRAGDWTRKLYDFAKSGGYTHGGGRQVKVMLEGPYGGAGQTIFASFSAAVFVVGGSGITFALSAIQDLIRNDLKGRSRVKIIELIWTIPDPASLVPLLPQLTAMTQESVFTPIRISVFYTRAPTGKSPLPDTMYVSGLTLAPGRPRIAKVLDAAICRAVSLGSGEKDSVGISGLIVGVCGPAAIGEDVVKAVGAVEALRRDQVGGIEIHEETFGW